MPSPSRVETACADADNECRNDVTRPSAWAWVAAECGEEAVGRVVRRRLDPGADDARAAVQLLALGEPRRHVVDQRSGRATCRLRSPRRRPRRGSGGRRRAGGRTRPCPRRRTTGAPSRRSAGGSRRRRPPRRRRRSPTAAGSAPSRSPSNRSPTSAIVLPPSSGAVQRSSPTTWLTSARTSQSAHGVGSAHWSSPIASTRSRNTSTVRRCNVDHVHHAPSLGRVANRTRPDSAACRRGPDRRSPSPRASRTRRPPGSPPAVAPDRRRRPRRRSAGRGGCGRGPGVHVDVGQLAVCRSSRRTGSPVSSIASRPAASHGVSPASTWPPGWTQMPSDLWCSSTMPRRPTTSADPVMCTGSACSSNGRSSRGTSARNRSMLDPLALVDRLACGDRGEHVLHGSSTAGDVSCRQGSARWGWPVATTATGRAPSGRFDRSPIRVGVAVDDRQDLLAHRLQLGRRQVGDRAERAAASRHSFGYDARVAFHTCRRSLDPLLEEP